MEEINPMVVEQMAHRLKNVVSSEAVMNDILGCRMPQAGNRFQNEMHHIPRFEMPQTTDNGIQFERNYIPHHRRPQYAEDGIQNPLAYVILGLKLGLVLMLIIKVN